MLFIGIAVLGHSGIASCEDAERPLHFSNSIGMNFVRVDAGVYSIGSTDTDKDANPGEKPRHMVEIANDFYIGRCEVTVGQFREFVEASHYISEVERSRNGGYGLDTEANELSNGPGFNWKATGFSQDKSHPVVNVSWNDAMAFCKWLSEKEKCEYRLPNEAEWESAVRLGENTIFAFGNDAKQICRFDNVCDAQFALHVPVEKIKDSAADNDGWAYTSPVGSFVPTRGGMYDVHGNVREWCMNWMRRYSGPEPPLDASAKKGHNKCVRGGSWLTIPRDARCARRDFLNPTECDCDLGFRVLLVIKTR